MSNRLIRAFLPLLLVPLLAARAHAQDQAVMITLQSGVQAADVNANGSVVIGTHRGPGGGFYWMPTTGDISVGGVEAGGVSLDGRTIVGTALDPQRKQQAAIWVRGTEWRLLGSVVPNAASCDALISSGYDVSADGKVVVGLAWDGCNFARAFRWEESTGMVDLGSTVSGRSSRANSVSGNGKVVIGWQEHAQGHRMGARWVDGRQTVFTGPGPAGSVGEAFAANTDGTIIVGGACRFGDGTDQSAWKWTPAGGMVCLPPPRLRLPLGSQGFAFSTSEDGRVIVGAQGFGLERESVIWIDGEPFYLKDYLRTHGVPNAFEDWVNTGAALSVSRDGRILVGFGAGPRDFTGYIVVLPPLGELK
jgi:probable HAF family extracellular repeat protein